MTLPRAPASLPRAGFLHCPATTARWRSRTKLTSSCVRRWSKLAAVNCPSIACSKAFRPAASSRQRSPRKSRRRSSRRRQQRILPEPARNATPAPAGVAAGRNIPIRRRLPAKPQRIAAVAYELQAAHLARACALEQDTAEGLVADEERIAPDPGQLHWGPLAAEEQQCASLHDNFRPRIVADIFLQRRPL